jgi:hypothetical protein
MCHDSFLTDQHPIGGVLVQPERGQPVSNVVHAPFEEPFCTAVQVLQLASDSYGVRQVRYAMDLAFDWYSISVHPLAPLATEH